MGRMDKCDHDNPPTDLSHSIIPSIETFYVNFPFTGDTCGMLVSLAFVPTVQRTEPMTLTETDYLKLFRACQYLGQDGEDAAQDAALFLMAHPGVLPDRETGELKPIDSPVGLGVAFAKGRVRNMHRRALVLNSLDARTPGADADGPTFGDTLAAADDRKARDIIRDAMRALPKASRIIVALMYRGYTQREIAARLAISPTALNNRLRRAVK